MDRAYSLHQAGELERADAVYREVLAEQPRHAEALFLRGEIANRLGRYEAAIEMLRTATALDRGVAAFHHEFALALHAAGKLAEAEQSYRKALEIDPNHRAALVDLASLLLARGMPGAAEQRSRQALRLYPKTVAAHVNLGSALEAQGRLEEATASYRAALQLDPACVQAVSNLGGALLNLDDLEQAERYVRKALEIDPRVVEAHINLGNILLQRRDPGGALRALREAVAVRPDSSVAHFNLGFALEILGDLEPALQCYETAIACDPENVQAHVNRATLWLLNENYAMGWPEYEWRLRMARNAPAHARFAAPRWDGSSLSGRSILVYGEQGLGDEIMYASCLPEIVAQAERCIIDCHPRLEPLFRRSFPRALVHAATQTGPADWLAAAGGVDFKVPIGSLPLYLRRSAADFPRHEGYLRASPERVQHWRARLDALGPTMKVGLSWRGGVPMTGRPWRSLALDDLLPVLRTRGVTFVNLQYGECVNEIERLERTSGIRLVHWPDALEIYDETAALVCALDLTVSVCTAVVHLAGALGCPAWVMAPVRPESRYGFKGESMRWYPSVRVFRQQAFGVWDGVLEEVVSALARAAAERS